MSRVVCTSILAVVLSVTPALARGGGGHGSGGHSGGHSSGGGHYVHGYEIDPVFGPTAGLLSPQDECSDGRDDE